MRTMIFPAGFDADDFLRNYWQKKPLLIRGDSFVDPITPEELAGLACEEFIESRLVRYYPGEKNPVEKNPGGFAPDSPEDERESGSSGTDNTAANVTRKGTGKGTGKDKARWKLSHGPFKEKDFLKLPEENYTLLVQAVDQWHEGVRGLLPSFGFIPSWRIDDIMISYSTHGGNVGPHFDYYDVFLIQGMGQKRWQLGGRADSRSKLRPNKEMRLLAEFSIEQDWILGPGDILYLPPNVAHWGTAIGNSMTYSVGFRTPSHAEILSELSDEIIQYLNDDIRYIDTDPHRPQRPGEIPPRVIAQLQQLLIGQLTRPEIVARWFGGSMTSPKYPEISVIVEERLDAVTLLDRLSNGAVLFKNPSARFAFIENQDRLQLFADGTEFTCPHACMALVTLLCANEDLPPELAQALALGSPAEASSESTLQQLSLLAKLYNQGSLLLET